MSLRTSCVSWNYGIWFAGITPYPMQHSQLQKHKRQMIFQVPYFEEFSSMNTHKTPTCCVIWHLGDSHNACRSGSIVRTITCRGYEGVYLDALTRYTPSFGSTSTQSSCTRRGCFRAMCGGMLDVSISFWHSGHRETLECSHVLPALLIKGIEGTDRTKCENNIFFQYIPGVVNTKQDCKSNVHCSRFRDKT